jgi:hypothetical protein
MIVDALPGGARSYWAVWRKDHPHDIVKTGEALSSEEAAPAAIADCQD